jgi:glutamine phosphoribosylpyrophosphate amidotransferase
MNLVYIFIDTDKDIIEKILIPDNTILVEDRYMTEQGERLDRVEAFVEKIKSNGKITLDFKGNCLNKIELNRKTIKKETINCILELIGEEEK